MKRKRERRQSPFEQLMNENTAVPVEVDNSGNCGYDSVYYANTGQQATPELFTWFRSIVYYKLKEHSPKCGEDRWSKDRPRCIANPIPYKNKPGYLQCGGENCQRIPVPGYIMDLYKKTAVKDILLEDGTLNPNATNDMSWLLKKDNKNNWKPVVKEVRKVYGKATDRNYTLQSKQWLNKFQKIIRHKIWCNDLKNIAISSEHYADELELATFARFATRANMKYNVSGMQRTNLLTVRRHKKTSNRRLDVLELDRTRRQSGGSSLNNQAFLPWGLDAEGSIFPFSPLSEDRPVQTIDKGDVFMRLDGFSGAFQVWIAANTSRPNDPHVHFLEGRSGRDVDFTWEAILRGDFSPSSTENHYLSHFKQSRIWREIRVFIRQRGTQGDLRGCGYVLFRIAKKRERGNEPSIVDMPNTQEFFCVQIPPQYVQKMNRFLAMMHYNPRGRVMISNGRQYYFEDERHAFQMSPDRIDGLITNPQRMNQHPLFRFLERDERNAGGYDFSISPVSSDLKINSGNLQPLVAANRSSHRLDFEWDEEWLYATADSPGDWIHQMSAARMMRVNRGRNNVPHRVYVNYGTNVEWNFKLFYNYESPAIGTIVLLNTSEELAAHWQPMCYKRNDGSITGIFTFDQLRSMTFNTKRNGGHSTSVDSSLGPALQRFIPENTVNPDWFDANEVPFKERVEPHPKDPRYVFYNLFGIGPG